MCLEDFVASVKMMQKIIIEQLIKILLRYLYLYSNFFFWIIKLSYLISRSILDTDQYLLLFFYQKIVSAPKFWVFLKIQLKFGRIVWKIYSLSRTLQFSHKMFADDTKIIRFNFRDTDRAIVKNDIESISICYNE